MGNLHAATQRTKNTNTGPNPPVPTRDRSNRPPTTPTLNLTPGSIR